jgi:hypothetical protein
MSKKKILLLSDDLRLHSGIATMSRHIVFQTVDKFDWIQVGAGINHPDRGKILDVSSDVQKETGVSDASVKIIPWNGYGDATLIRQLLEIEKPDAILHFTDPRYFVWLYEIEAEIRQQCALIYYNIWDNLPDPMWNAAYYASCDALLGISRQTYGINRRVLETKYGDELDIVLIN